MTEGETLLVQRARDGDRDAIAGLFERYRLRVIRFCLTFTPIREADAHDLTQETFIRAFRGIRRLREVDRFESWLFSIARRRCMTFLQGAWRKRQESEQFVTESRMQAEPDAEEERARALECQIVAEEIERLPESPMKQAGKLFYLEDRDTGSISRVLGAPVSTITTWLSRLRAKIRHRLVLRILELRGHPIGEVS